MLFFKKKTPYEKEMAAVLKKERRFLQSRKDRKESFVNQKLEQFVPQKLQSGIDSAFAKAFGLIFEKGTKVIEKTYNRKNLEIDFYENQYMNAVLENKKTLRAFSKKAKTAGNKNLFLSGTAGVGMGILGVGIPDIPVFTALILKSIYEIALDYGFDYESEKERAFILWVIETAVSCGETAISDFTAVASVRILLPFRKASPLVGCVRQHSILIVVVFPAPFTPSKENNSPL